MILGGVSVCHFQEVRGPTPRFVGYFNDRRQLDAAMLFQLSGLHTVLWHAEFQCHGYRSPWSSVVSSSGFGWAIFMRQACRKITSLCSVFFLVLYDFALWNDNVNRFQGWWLRPIKRRQIDKLIGGERIPVSYPYDETRWFWSLDHHHWLGSNRNF